MRRNEKRGPGGMENLVRGNRTVSPGPCRMDDYMSPGNNIPTSFSSILNANVTARLQEKDMEHCSEAGVPFSWDYRGYEMRRRYRKEVVSEGHSNHDKSPDGVV
jgi:hypothetical protein